MRPNAYLSFSLSRRYEPNPDPVPPAMEWQSTNPWKEAECRQLKVQLRPRSRQSKACCATAATSSRDLPARVRTPPVTTETMELMPVDRVEVSPGSSRPQRRPHTHQATSARVGEIHVSAHTTKCNCCSGASWIPPTPEQPSE